jgi:hypothetical protein
LAHQTAFLHFQAEGTEGVDRVYGFCVHVVRKMK